MKFSFRRIGAITLFISLGWAQLVNAQTEEVKIVAASNQKALPYDLEIHQREAGISVSGRLLKSPANLSRRFYGKVHVELLDANGDVIAVHYAEPRRLGMAKHPQRTRFHLDIENLSHDLQTLRVSYH